MFRVVKLGGSLHKAPESSPQCTSRNFPPAIREVIVAKVEALEFMATGHYVSISIPTPPFEKGLRQPETWPPFFGGLVGHLD